MNKYIFPAVIILALGAMIGLFILGNKNDATTTPGQQLLGDKHADLGQKHIAINEAHDPYNSNLPSSGPHYIKPATWGIQDKTVVDEVLVHNEEHGGIVIAYKPELPPAEVAKLMSIFAKLPQSSKFNEIKAVLVSRPSNYKLIELGAWTYTLSLDTVDEEKILAFYNSHLDKGPELVP